MIYVPKTIFSKSSNISIRIRLPLLLTQRRPVTQITAINKEPNWIVSNFYVAQMWIKNSQPTVFEDVWSCGFFCYFHFIAWWHLYNALNLIKYHRKTVKLWPNDHINLLLISSFWLLDEKKNGIEIKCILWSLYT